MGIQDRDYYRDGASGFLDAWSRQGATVWIIVVTCVVFFAQFLSGHPGDSKLVSLGSYSPVLVLNGEVWRLFTPMLLHASLLHLFFNMFALYIFGWRLEETYGTREFLVFYIVAGAFAQLVYLFVYLAGLADPRITTIGASGAITAVVILFVFNFPRQQLLLFGIIPMPTWLLGVLYVAWDTFGAMGQAGNQTAYVVHLGGALFAVLYYQSGVRITRLFSRQPRAEYRTHPRLHVVPADTDDTPEPVGAAVESQPRPKEVTDVNLEAKVDQVLEKVSKYGQESLTPEEREILFKASELYKKRRK